MLKFLSLGTVFKRASLAALLAAVFVTPAVQAQAQPQAPKPSVFVQFFLKLIQRQYHITIFVGVK